MSISKTEAIQTAARHVRLIKMGHNAYAVHHPYDWDKMDGPTRCDAPRSFQLARRKRTETVARIALYLMGFDSELEQMDGEFQSAADLVSRGISTCARRASA